VSTSDFDDKGLTELDDSVTQDSVDVGAVVRDGPTTLASVIVLNTKEFDFSE